MRILIVTYNWPPRNAIGTHRPYSWAKYWAKNGAAVTVLTAEKQVYDQPLDLSLEVLEGVKVIEVSYRSKSALTGLLRSAWVRNVARRILNWVRRKQSVKVDPRLQWRKACEPFVFQVAKSHDVVVSTYGPSAAHLIAFDCKQVNPALFWVADYRDLWSQSNTVKLPERTRQTERMHEINSVGRAANIITTVSNDLKDKLSTLLTKKVLLAPNGFDFSINGSLFTKNSNRDGRLPLRIVYTGTLYPKHRDPLPLLEAIAKLIAVGKIDKTAVIVEFYGERIELVRELAQRMEYHSFIEIKGHVNRETALRAQRTSGLLLLLESPEIEARGVLTGKLFEYIASGRPILCIGSDPDYEIGKVLAATGTGIVIGPKRYKDLESLVLETINGHGIFEFYKPNFAEISKYSREKQAFELYEQIENEMLLKALV